jgi:hypothetical protein
VHEVNNTRSDANTVSFMGSFIGCVCAIQCPGI